jgi:hypothetical protein
VPASSSCAVEEKCRDKPTHWVCPASRKLTNAAKLTPEKDASRQGGCNSSRVAALSFSSPQRRKFQPVCQTGPWANRTAAPTPLSSIPPGLPPRRVPNCDGRRGSPRSARSCRCVLAWALSGFASTSGTALTIAVVELMPWRGAGVSRVLYDLSWRCVRALS